MEGQNICKEINIQLTKNNKPKFILLDSKSFVEFEDYQKEAFGVPPIQPGNLHKIKRVYSGIRILMVLTDDKFIEVV